MKELCRLTAEEVQDVVAAVRVAVHPVLHQNLQVEKRISYFGTMHTASVVHGRKTNLDIRVIFGGMVRSCRLLGQFSFHWTKLCTLLT